MHIATFMIAARPQRTCSSHPGLPVFYLCTFVRQRRISSILIGAQVISLPLAFVTSIIPSRRTSLGVERSWY